MGFKLAAGDKPLNGYVIRRGLGTGGFGEVYFAVSDSGKEVALKRIHRNLDVEVRGASQCLNLRHPNLVGLYDIRHEDSEQAWIVMEYIAGETLMERLDRHPNGLPTVEALHVFGQMAAGVQYLHDQGIVHRDLKPANIFLDNNWVKIGDYGLSKFISASRRGGHTESVGTFHYMAPEIGKGEYGKEIDIYSLGIMLYEVLTGKVPFDGESSQEIILKHLTADPDVSQLSPAFQVVILMALAKDPKQRYSSVTSMLTALGITIDKNGMATNNPAPNHQPTNSINGFAVPSATADSFDASTPMNAPKIYYREPIANAVALGLAELQTQFNRIPYGSPWHALAIVSTILILVFFGPAIIPFLVMAFLCYVPYYIVWSFLNGKSHWPTAPIAQPVRTIPIRNVKHSPAQPATSPKKMRPLSFQEWQSIQRQVLANKPFANRWAEWTGSTLLAASILGVLTLAGYLIALAVYPAWTESTSFIAIGVWMSTMSLLATWTILFFAKRWENRPEDTLIYRFVMLTCGLALGGIGWGLSEFLMVPWDSVMIIRTVPRALDWSGFYSERNPSWPAFVAYFGLLMGCIRWWRQGDILRRYRFSLFTVLWSVMVAALVCGLVYFPTPWCLVFAGVTSALTQMSTLSIDSKKRPRFVEVARGDDILL
jgi:eukaryotic-like serine/threonine-protein kinase